MTPEEAFDLVRRATEDFYSAQLMSTGIGGGVQTSLLRFIARRVAAVPMVENRTAAHLLAIGFRALYLATEELRMGTEEDEALRNQLLEVVSMPLQIAKDILGEKWDAPG